MERGATTTTRQQQRHEKNSAPMTSIQHALTHESSTIQTMIVVVTKIAVDAVNSKAQVLIADDSIPENAYARVSLSGSDTVTTSLAKVCAGDVLSFHGFQVTIHDSSKFPLVADFQSSWQEPGAGWTRLYASKIGGPVSCAQERDATKRVESLIYWCSRSKFNDSIPSLPACRRRRLSELHTIGMTSHVVVKVTSIDTAGAPADCMSASRKREKDGYRSRSIKRQLLCCRMEMMSCHFQSVLRTRPPSRKPFSLEQRCFSLMW